MRQWIRLNKATANVTGPYKSHEVFPPPNATLGLVVNLTGRVILFLLIPAQLFKLYNGLYSIKVIPYPLKQPLYLVIVLLLTRPSDMSLQFKGPYPSMDASDE